MKDLLRKRDKLFGIAVLFLASMFIMPELAFSANHYVRAGATGSGNGLDWTNAFTSLPATLVRGDTYFIADGNYPSYRVDDPVNGTDYIYILKATLVSHGTNTGWDNTFGDGQAIFSGTGGFGGIISITTSYVVFDGIVGVGSNPSSYGFSVATPSNCNQNNDLIGMPPVGYYSSLQISNVTLSHVAVTNCGINYNIGQRTIYSFPLSASNITISHNYISNGNTNILIRNWSNSIITDNYFDGNWENTGNSGQQISPASTSDIVLSSNVFKNTTSFVVGAHQDAPNYRWKIFNNIVIGYSGTALPGGFGSAVINNIPDDNVVINWEVHHNTFIGIKFSSYGAIPIGPLTDVTTQKSTAYNNLFYNCSNARLDNPGCTDCYSTALDHGYTAHYNSSGTFDASESGTAQVSTGSPFINVAAGNYALNAQTSQGKILNAPFNVDYTNKTRGHFDRGAYEYTGKIPARITTLQFK